MNMIKSDERHVVGTVHARREHRDEVGPLLLELVEPARDEPGCLYYDLYQDRSDPDIFYIINGWVSDDAVVGHQAHPNLPRVLGQLSPLLADPLSMAMSQRLSEPR